MTPHKYFPLQRLSERAKDLTVTFTRLFEVIDQQISAIIKSDIVAIENLTDEHASLHQTFKKQEAAFIDELQSYVPEDYKNDVPGSLTLLKEIYPDYKIYISELQKHLTSNINLFKRNQEQLTELLNFAREQNSGLMQTIYNMQNRNYKYYGQNGECSAVSSGITVNQNA